MYKFVLVLLASPLCLGAPQEGFGDASAQEIAEIRAGTYLETFDENPQYSFNYKVADDTEQTYMAMNEDRAGDQVTGSYQYVDPLGSLIIVSYTAGPMGYTETREVKEGFVQIQQRPAKQSSSSSSSFNGASSGSSFSGSSGSSFNGGSSFNSGSSFNGGSSFSSNTGSSSSFSSDDIVNAVVSQVQPLISQTVSSAVSGSRRTSAPAPLVVPAAPLSTTVFSNNANSDSIVSQVVSNIAPLVSQTVSSAVSGSNLNSGSRFQASRPAPIPAPRAPRPVQASASTSRNVGSVSELFGSGGDFNVRFNTPSFNIEY
ncbi:P17/29C-like protein DDB_G0287399 [Eurytemora carolleeae]|uniref:P17/29C-like protein DDB_G0287399 n=1 Tax=Eurytemora carolleeae TaxID=1294199 RepID=UPI000C757E6D|nr:P17/29C-like protein DDB_G0287399 [Eurytemora carolleeae]|eukprot:XP_023340739.1 P17/29C-like protein DDB_G0287399 [Eurytemora affinis]